MSWDTDGEQYRAARASIVEHLDVQRQAERAHARAIKAGADPGQVEELLAACHKAEADVVWCRALTVACGEVVKGESFATVLKRHAERAHKATNVKDLR